MAVLIPRAAPAGSVAPLPGVRQTARLDTSVLQRGIGQLGDAAQQYIQREIDLADQAALMEARNALSAWEGQIKDPSNPNGLRAFQGKESLRAGEVLLPQADAHISQIRQRLTPRQQQQFDLIAGNFKAQFHEGVNRWADRQFTAYEDATFQATNENLLNDAVAAGLEGDWTRQAQIANELVTINRAHLSTRGMGEELIKQRERGLVSNIHAATVDGMMTADPQAAMAYYDRWADQMLPADRAKIERALYPVVEDLAADSYADAIVGGQAVQADDPQTIDAAIVQLESAGVDTATATTSSATGAGQFVKSTWLQVIRKHRPDLAEGKTDEEILALRTDGALSREMVAAYRRDNTAILQANGVQTTAENVYAAHHFGPGGAVAFARASGDTPMSEILTAGQMRANPYLQGKTKAEVIAMWRRRGLPGGEVNGVAMASAPPASKAEAIARAREIRDPRLRRAVERKIVERFALRELQEAEAAKAQDEAANIALTENPTMSLREALGAEGYARAVREGKLEAWERVRLAKIQGTFVQDDPVFVEEVSREAVTDFAAFLRRNFDDPEVQERLSTAQLAAFKKMQAEGRKPGTQQDWATEEQRLNTAFTTLGLTTDGLKGKRKDEVNRRRGEFRLAWMSAERELIQLLDGKKPTPEQYDRLLDGVVRTFSRRMAEGKVDPRRFEGETVPGMYSRGAQFRSEITPAERQGAIEAYRRKYGTNPTETQITEAVIKMRSLSNG